MAHHTHCTYKFENGYMQESGIHPEEEQHKFHEWHKVVLVLFGIAIISALTALCFSFCAICIRICAIVTNVTALIAAMSSSFAMAIFFISSHRNDIRFVPGITYTYEVSFPWSNQKHFGDFFSANKRIFLLSGSRINDCIYFCFYYQCFGNRHGFSSGKTTNEYFKQIISKNSIKR